jgi:hypothetical protein
MQLIADFLMAAGAFGAAVYCYILARKLNKFQTLESGMGGAIAVLSAQVDDMTRALDEAHGAAISQAGSLAELTRRGESVAARLELTLATMHDLPGQAEGRGSTTDTETQEKRLRFVRRRGHGDQQEAAE